MLALKQSYEWKFLNYPKIKVPNFWSNKVYKKWGVTDLPPLKESRPEIR
jgi:hypothetical protein